MKVAVISDTHLGDPTSQLCAYSGNPKSIRLGSRFQPLVDALLGEGGKLDYLILAGDILDFSVASYEEAYNCARVFFQALTEKGVTEEFIYLPGNHDADLWLTLQQQRHVIMKVAEGKDAEQFAHSVPGVLDLRAASQDKRIWLRGVAPLPDVHPRTYGGLFLSHLTKPASKFNVAYPNLYLLTDEESILVTHGQYFEAYWAFLGALALFVAKKQLNLGDINIEEMMELNFPLVQLSCSGVGQAGVLTDRIIRPVQKEATAKSPDTPLLSSILNRLEQWAEDQAKGKFFRKIIYRILADKGGDMVLDAIRASKKSGRDSDPVESEPENWQRLLEFYNASMFELIDIRKELDFVPFPDRILYGHTHKPKGLDAKGPRKAGPPNSGVAELKTGNMGGWLEDDGVFNGAEVFIYDTAKKPGLQSVRIS